MNRLVATFFYVGLLRPAPGTWGSLAALPVGWALHLAGGTVALALGIAAAFFGGWAATRARTAGSADKDPSEIVIDEVAGQWIAILPLSLGAMRTGADILALWPGWVAAFLLFRLFDIWKPGPVGWADRRGDPLGVMLDDVIAGIFAALGVVVLAAIAHGVMLA
ncbi:phosphatidylglycerophosphatase A [Palleronia salina]|uniref:Phosphatidylglycerophosphatase A n=1 Tax=Palleronia salina TaxID=313368 RepID=A0A1M6B414_9RHOB|nr:phosphatidylglycerophosphatase A [Palleronia salina]SHI43420.1 phosphatidylglycerophosphatase A [Palleronia salina]